MQKDKLTKKAGINMKAFASNMMQRPWTSGLLPFVVLCILVAFVNPNFYSSDNIIDMLRTGSYSLVVGCALTFLMITSGLDLSLDATISFGGVIAAECMVCFDMPILLSVIMAVLVCTFVGWLKAFVIVHYSLPPFIITLGFQYMINGLILVITKGMTVTDLPSEFKFLGQGSIFKGTRIYNAILIALVVAVVFHFALEKTKFGRNLCAVGGNIETARVAGIRVDRYKYICYMLVSALGGFAGILYASRFSSAMNTIGNGMGLNIISATVIGGTSLFGGAGTIVGTDIGCVLFAAITNALIMMKVSVYWQNFVFGLILIISIIVDKYRRSAKVK